MKAVSTLLLAAPITMAIGIAGAHHSISGQFDPDKVERTTGELVKYELINPHSYITFSITNAKGEKELWSFETGAPAALRRAGVRAADVFVAGQVYEISYHPSRTAGNHSGLLNTITTPEGKLYGMGSTNSLEASR